MYKSILWQLHDLVRVYIFREWLCVLQPGSTVVNIDVDDFHSAEVASEDDLDLDESLLEMSSNDSRVHLDSSFNSSLVMCWYHIILYQKIVLFRLFRIVLPIHFHIHHCYGKQCSQIAIWLLVTVNKNYYSEHVGQSLFAFCHQQPCETVSYCRWSYISHLSKRLSWEMVDKGCYEMILGRVSDP